MGTAMNNGSSIHGEFLPHIWGLKLAGQVLNLVMISTNKDHSGTGSNRLWKKRSFLGS